MKWYDTHTHLVSDRAELSPEEVVQRAQESGVALINSVGTDLESSHEAVGHAKKFPGVVYAFVGVIPLEVHQVDDLAGLRTWISELVRDNPAEIVAIGEIGLDYYYKDDNKDWQKQVLIVQLELARELNLPVNIHCRGAHDDFYEIIKDYQDLTIVMHCFTEDWAQCQRFLELGCYISIPGVVTFKKAFSVHEMAKNVPLDRLLIETDAPYLSPTPYRGKLNEAKNVRLIGEFIAKLRDMDAHDLSEIIMANSKRVFNVK